MVTAGMTLNSRTIAAAATTLLALAFTSVGTSAHVANTLSASSGSQLKPVIRGLIAQGGYPPESLLPDIQGVVADVTWAQLQPAQSDNQNLTVVHPNPIDDLLKSMQKDPAKSHVLVKVRVFTGNSSPGWAMNLGGPAFWLNDFACSAKPPPAGCNGGSRSYLLPRWWASGYQAAYDRLEKALGAAYDGIPAITEVNSPRCMVFWAESMARPNDAWSEANLLNAGYTVPSDIACLHQEMLSQATAWPHLRVTVNLNAYQDFFWKNGVPAHAEDPTATQAIIDFCRLQLAAQCVLANEELGRDSATPGNPTYSYLYPMMQRAGLPTNYQVDTPGWTHNRPLNQILDVAVGWHASSVEMTNHYLGSHPPSFFAAYDQALKVPGCSSAVLTPDKPFPQPAGTVLAFTATSAGCANPQYQFWLQYPGGPWIVVQPFSSVPKWTWHTTGSRPGTYSIVVWANQNGNPKTTYQSYAQQVAPLAGCGRVSVNASPRSPQPRGKQIQLTATPTVCANPLFQFWMLAPGSGTWQDLRAYSANAVLKWNSSGMPAGTYSFSVWAKDSASGGASGNTLGRWDAYLAFTYRLN